MATTEIDSLTDITSQAFQDRAAEVESLRRELLDEYISQRVDSPPAVVASGAGEGAARRRGRAEAGTLLRRMLELEKALYKNPQIEELPPFVGEPEPDLASPSLEALAPPKVDPEARNARAVVLIVRKDLLPFDERRRVYRFAEALTAREYFQLCAGEMYADQITARGEGSGFLVAPRSILTAAHCVDERWRDLYFVFDFLRLPDGSARTEFGPDDVYEAEQIVKKDGTLPGDWALVRLKREVAGREPVSLRRAGEVRRGEELYIVGHPLTLPKKKARGGRVRYTGKPVTFTAALDVFGGNSGSPVFSQRTHEVEGILVDGAVDLIRNPEPGRSCRIARILPDTGAVGEIVTRITEVLKVVRDEDLV